MSSDALSKSRLQGPRFGAAFQFLWITDEKIAKARGLGTAERIRTDLAGARSGSGAVIYRRKEVDESSRQRADLMAVARVLHAQCRAQGISFFSHDLVGIDPADRDSFDGVHLSSGTNAVAVREQVGSDKIIGQSFHVGDIDRDLSGLDYITYSPVFAPGSKPDDTRPLVGLEGLMNFCKACQLPVFALGGINSGQRHQSVLAAGARGSAGLSTWSC